MLKVKLLRMLLAGLLVVFFVGCAGGDLLDGNGENQGDGSHVGDADGDGGTGDGTGDSGTGDGGTGDGGTGDGGPGDGGTGDGGTGDGGTGDGGTGDGGTGDGGTGDGGTGDGGTGDGTGDGTTDLCALVDCSEGVCDPDTGECVGCLSDGDCGTDLVCDEASNTCLGCHQDSDCPGAERCHHEYPVCVAECCDFVTQDAFTGISSSHNSFDIAVTGDGTPMIVFGDRDAEKLRLAQKSSGIWLSQDFGDFPEFSINLRLDIDGKGDPHIVARNFNQWRYYWRDGSGWHQEEVWNESVGDFYTDIKVDDDGKVHIIGNDWHELYYARRNTDGTWLRQTYEWGDGQNIVWIALGLTVDGEPVVSGSLFEDSVWQVFVAERSGGAWSDELVVNSSTQVHHMAVSPTDEIMIFHRGISTPHDGLKVTRNGSGGWVEEIVDPDETANGPNGAIDSRGDPHIVYQVSLASPLAYTRWDGAEWENNLVPESVVEQTAHQRIAVDDNYVAHIAGYSSSNSTIFYVTVE